MQTYEILMERFVFDNLKRLVHVSLLADFSVHEHLWSLGAVIKFGRGGHGLKRIDFARAGSLRHKSVIFPDI